MKLGFCIHGRTGYIVCLRCSRQVLPTCHAWHTIPSCVSQIYAFLAHMPSTAVHEGIQQDPSSFCPCGAKVKGIPLRSQHLQTVPISKQSTLATVGDTERNLCRAAQVHLPPGQVLSHSCPFSSCPMYQLDGYIMFRPRDSG